MTKPHGWIVRLLALSGAALLLSGCISSMLAKKIVLAPNQQEVPEQLKDPKMLALIDQGLSRQVWRVPVGPPSAELSVAVVEPADYKLVYMVKKEEGTGELQGIKFSASTSSKNSPPITRAPAPKATLVLLHGLMMTKESMVPWALYFAQQGYRVVLVDLRGHGRSTGRWIGFGAWEAADLTKVVDDLDRRGLLIGRLGVFGISYGAAIGIHWAARDSRVGTVVTLAPFSDPQRAVVEFARGIDPKHLAKLGDETFAKAEAKAAAMAGFRWHDVNVLDSIRRMQAPVLFFHGERDGLVAPVHSEQLAQAAPPGSRREVLPKVNHLTLQMRLDLIGPPALAWFDERLTGIDSGRAVRGK